MVEVRWPANGLAGIGDDGVEPVARLEQLAAERLDAGRVPEVEPEDLQPVAPLGEIRLASVAGGRIAWKACRNDQLRAGAKQLEARLIADLHATAGEQRDAPAQVGELRPLREVELRALRAELVVEVMDRLVVALADVAVLELERLAEFRIVVEVLLLEIRRREVVRR